jgi:hypothetical protein
VSTQFLQLILRQRKHIRPYVFTRSQRAATDCVHNVYLGNPVRFCVGGEPGRPAAEAAGGHRVPRLLQEGAHRPHIHGLKELG